MAAESHTDAKGTVLESQNHHESSAGDNKLELFHYYNMRGKNNYAVVFNHFKYRKGHYGKLPKERIGTASDAKRLRSTFERLNFKVTVHTDLSYDDTIDEMQRISKMDHKDTGCVAVILLTHGESSGVVLAADREYQIEDLWRQLTSDVCPGLVAKPKLFFIQACRGGDVDDGVAIDSYSPGLKLPTMADFLIMYSTVEEFVSWRDVAGSWFIQSLCDELDLNSGHEDLLTMLTLVNWRVAYTRSSFTPSNSKMDNKKQMPQIVSMLTKLLKF